MSIFKDNKARNALRSAGLLDSEANPTNNGYCLAWAVRDDIKEMELLKNRIASLEASLGYTYEGPSGARHVKIKKPNK